MTALAIADSPLAREQLANHTLTIDYLETGGPLTEGTIAQFPNHPLLLHNSVYDWSLGHPDALHQDNVVEITHRAIAMTRTPWLSLHLGFSAAEVGFDGWMQARSPVLDRDELFANICRNINTLQEMIDVPIILENLDYCAGGAYEYICEPDFIAAVVEEGNVGMLLDLAHAQVSAVRLGIPIEEYMARLPLQRVWQLHISGPRWANDTLNDWHEDLREEDYALLQNVLQQTNPKALTLEYKKDARLLHEQLVQLRSMV